MDALRFHEATMAGVARYVEWRKKFLDQWQENVERMNTSQALALLPPEVKDEVLKAVPDLYDVLADRAGQQKGV